MGSKKKHKEDKVVVVAEFKVSMHCNACERTVAKAISKIKGVEKFITDMPNHRVEVTGRINPQKILKKLKKKTGKKVELIERKEDVNDKKDDDDDVPIEYSAEQVLHSWLDDCYGSSEVHLILNDENANACLIM